MGAVRLLQYLLEAPIIDTVFRHFVPVFISQEELVATDRFWHLCASQKIYMSAS